MSSALDQLLLAESQGRRKTAAESARGTIDSPEQIQRQASRVNTFVDPGPARVDRMGIQQLTSGLERFSSGFKRGADAVIQEWSKNETEKALVGFAASGEATLSDYEEKLAQGEDPVTLGRVARNALESVSGVRQGQEAAASIEAAIQAGEFDGMDPVEARDAMNAAFAEAISEVPEGEQFYFSTVQAEQFQRLSSLQVAHANEKTATDAINFAVADVQDGDGTVNEETVTALQSAASIQGEQVAGFNVAKNLAMALHAQAEEHGSAFTSVDAGVSDIEAEVEELMKAAGLTYKMTPTEETQLRDVVTKTITLSERGGQREEAEQLKDVQDYLSLNPDTTFDEMRNLFPEARPYAIRDSINRVNNLIDPRDSYEESLKKGVVPESPDMVATGTLAAIPYQTVNIDPFLSKDGNNVMADALNQIAQLRTSEDRSIYLTGFANQYPREYQELAQRTAWYNMSPEDRLVYKEAQDPAAFEDFVGLHPAASSQATPTSARSLLQLSDDTEGSPSSFSWFGAGDSDVEVVDKYIAQLDAELEQANEDQRAQLLYGSINYLDNVKVYDDASSIQKNRLQREIEFRLQKDKLPPDARWTGPYPVQAPTPNPVVFEMAEGSTDMDKAKAVAEGSARAKTADVYKQAIFHSLDVRPEEPTPLFDHYGKPFTQVGKTHVVELVAEEEVEELAEEVTPLTEAGTIDLSATMMGRVLQGTAAVVDFVRSPIDTTADAIRPAYMENKPSRNN